MDDLNKVVEEILEKVYQFKLQNLTEMASWQGIIDMDWAEMHDEATQALTTLINNEKIEARIDELNNVQTEYGGRFLAVTYITGDPQTIEFRIAELKATLKKGEK